MLRKIVIAVTVFLIAFFGVLYFWGGPALENLAKEIAANEKIAGGQLKFKQAEASWNGTVYLIDSQWENTDKTLTATIPKVGLKLNIFDAIIHGGSEKSISDISLYEPVLELKTPAKKQQSLKEALDNSMQALNNKDFTNTLTFINGKLQLGSSKDVIDGINGSIDFKENNKKVCTLAGKYYGAEIFTNVKMDSLGNEGFVKATGLPVNKFFSKQDSLRLTQGKVNINLNWSKKDKKEEATINGLLSNGSGFLYKLPITKLAGAFHGDLNAVNITKMDFELAKQPVQLHGKILLGTKSDNRIRCDLDFNSGQFSLKALTKGINITDGISVQGKLTGVLNKPILDGDFGVKVCDFAPLKINDLHGSFLYFNDKLHIANAVGFIENGMAKADGEIVLKTGDFKFNLFAENIAADTLTDNQISGLCTLDAVIMGSNEADSVSALGNFTVTDGKYKNVPFSKISGKTVYTGGEYRFADIYLHTILGRLPLDAILLDNGKVRFNG